MKKLLVLLVTLVMVLATTGCGGNTNGLKDGVYTGSAQGMNDVVEVSVEIKEGKIADVQVTKDAETPGIGGPLKDANGTILNAGGKTPVERIPEEIVANQTLDIDAVTGATISSYAVLGAVKDALTKAGADFESFKGEVAREEVADLTTDVVVVGGGGAGLAAAIAAGQQGANVIVVEKNGSIGGDTLVCGAIYNTPNEALQSQVEMTDAVKATIEKALAEEPVSDEHAALQAEVQAQWDQYKAEGRTDLFDTPEWYALQTWINGDKVGDLDLVKTMCYNSYNGLEWIESLGMKFSDKISQGAGSLWQRTHTSTMQMGTGFMSTYVQNIIDDEKVNIIVEKTAKELVTTDGRVTAVKCVDNLTGKEFTINANMGVILATGGFAANGKMVQEHNTTGKWSDLSKTMTTNRFSCSQGEGITMAEAVGASLTDMEQVQLLYLGNTKDGQITKYPPRNVNGTDQIIFVNKEGQRFVNEGGRRDEICLNVLNQTDGNFFILESADGAGYKDITDPSWVSGDGFSFQYLVDNGYILVADTLEEMAGKIGCDPATLQATVDSFNAAVESGSDEFGRTLFSTKLENGPWVACPRTACVHHTMGGVTIDLSTRVLDTNGNPISGLFAAGEITGGIHGANRLGGNAVVDTVVFGKLAGETVVADAK